MSTSKGYVATTCQTPGRASTSSAPTPVACSRWWHSAHRSHCRHHRGHVDDKDAHIGDNQLLKYHDVIHDATLYSTDHHHDNETAINHHDNETAINHHDNETATNHHDNEPATNHHDNDALTGHHLVSPHLYEQWPPNIAEFR